MSNFIEAIKKQKELELEEIKKDIKNGIPVRINPNSYVAKEIFYQTLILKNIERDVAEIKRLLLKSNP